MLNERTASHHSTPDPNRRQQYRRHEDFKLRQRNRQLEAARLISLALSEHINVGGLVERALNTALEVIDAEAGSVLLANQETKQLVFCYSIGVKPVQPGTAIPWEQGIDGAVFTSGEPLIIADAKRDPRHFAGIDGLTGYNTRDMIVLPLKRWEGKPIGVLNVLNKRKGTLDEDDVPILTIIAALTAISIEHARLFEEAKLVEVARLLGDIGHDIKNMLMPVVMGAGIMQSELDDLFGPSQPSKEAETRERFLSVIGMLRNSSQRIQERVKGIADCLKGMSSPPQFAPCTIVNVVRIVEDILGLPAQQKNISLRDEGLETLPEIMGDEQRLFNAFYNLINNAIPEVPEGGAITVRGLADPATKSVVVSVIDTGRGMPPEIRDSLFTAHAISRKPGGTGLGTKIVKDVVDAHGGRVTVESAEGVGTVFHITLPILPPGAAVSGRIPSNP